MKTMCLPGYHQIGFVATLALCTWTLDILLHIVGTNEPKSAHQAKQGAQ